MEISIEIKEVDTKNLDPWGFVYLNIFTTFFVVLLATLIEIVHDYDWKKYAVNISEVRNVMIFT